MIRITSRRRLIGLITALVTATLGLAAINVPAGASTGGNTSLSGLSLTLGSHDAGALSEYTLDFTTAAAGATTIHLTAPPNTVFSEATDSHYYLSDDDHGLYDTIAKPGQGQGSLTDNPVTISMKDASTLPANDAVELVMDIVTNPEPGTYTVGVSTDTDTAAVQTAAYTVNPALAQIGQDYTDGQGYDAALTWHDGYLSGLVETNAGEQLVRFPTTGAMPDDPVTLENPNGASGYAGLTEAPDGSFYTGIADAKGFQVERVLTNGSVDSTPFTASQIVTPSAMTSSTDGTSLYFDGTVAAGAYSELFATSLPPKGNETPIMGAGGCSNDIPPYFTPVPLDHTCLSETGEHYISGGLAVVGDDLYILDLSFGVEKIDLEAGTVVTIGGNHDAARGCVDGATASAANLDWSYGLAVDRAGDIFVGAKYGTELCEITAGGTMHLLAGGGSQTPGPGVAPTAAKLWIESLAVDLAGNVYLTTHANDSGSNPAHPADLLLRLAGAAAAAAVPGAPRTVTTAPSDKGATVRFDAPSDDGGLPVTGYDVTAHPHGASDTSGDVTVSANSSPVPLWGLRNGVTYDISVVAKNQLGHGDAASASVTPGAPNAVLTADVTSGQVGAHGLTVHLDASGSRIPDRATFTFYCGDSTDPIGPASAATSATCTYYRGSPSTSWRAWVSMHDPATNRDYQATVPITVQPPTGTVDDSAAFPAQLGDDLVVAADGSLTGDTSACGTVTLYYATCLTADDAIIKLSAVPGTFATGTHVHVYLGDTGADKAALQQEITSNLTTAGGFDVSWTPDTNLSTPLLVTVMPDSTQASPTVRTAHTMKPMDSMRPMDAGGWAGFFGGIWNGLVSGTTKVLSTVGNAISAGASAVSHLWQSAPPSVQVPNPDPDTPTDLVTCQNLSYSNGKWHCDGFFVMVDPSLFILNSIETAGHVIAAGGGNVIAAGGGNVIAAGGGNLGGGEVQNFAVDAAAFTIQAASVIAAGGGNVIAAGGGNVIAAGGGNLLGEGAAGLLGDLSNFEAVSSDQNFSAGFFHDPALAYVTSAADPDLKVTPTVTATSAAGAGGTYPAGSAVTVHLAASSSETTSVQNVGFSTTGAQTAPATLVAGSSAAVVIDQSGTTTLTYWAQDANLNQSDPQTLTITIDAPAQAPDAPSGVVASDVDLHSAEVSWTAPADNGTPIVGYTVWAIDDGTVDPSNPGGDLIGGSTDPQTFHFDASTTTRQISGLTTGHMYVFEVTASNGLDSDLSVPNADGSSSTFIARVPDAPTNLTVTPADGKVTLTWDDMSGDQDAMGGLPLNSYFVQRSTSATGPWTDLTPTGGPDDLPDLTTPALTDTDVTDGQTYYYQVWAENAVGEGAVSATSATPGAAKQDQTITFTAPTGLTYGDPPVALDATASSNLAVSYTSSTQSVCTVAQDQLTIVSAGTCTIVAGQDGNTSYNPAPGAPATFTIAKAALTITASDATMTAGGALPRITPSYDGLVNGDTAPTTPPTCTADETTKTTSCSDAADPNYDITYVDGTLTVTPAGGTSSSSSSPAPPPPPPPSGPQSQTITFTAPSGLTYGDSPVPLSGSASSGLAVSYTSSTPAVCSVALDQLTVLAAGTCTVTATQPGDGGYRPASEVTDTTTVARAPLTITASNAALSDGTITPAVTATYTGLVNGDTAPATPPTCRAHPRGHYTHCWGAQDPDYDITYRRGTLTDERVAQDVTVTVRDLSYADSGAHVHASANSGRHVSLTAAPAQICQITGRHLSVAGAGTCTITAHVRGSQHWAPVTTAFPVPIGRAPLRITAADATMTDGRPAPTVTPIYSGFAHGDSPNALTTQPTCAAHPRHHYTHCWGAAADNYRIHYRRGQLTILAPLAVRLRPELIHALT